MACSREAHRIEGTDLCWFQQAPTAPTSLAWAVIFDVREWEACCYEWRSVMSQNLLCPAMAALPPGVRAVQSSDVQDLLPLAARHCFWSLGIMAHKALGKELGIDVAGETLFDTCWNLVHGVLDCSDDERLGFVQKRLKSMKQAQDACSEVFLELGAVNT